MAGPSVRPMHGPQSCRYKDDKCLAHCKGRKRETDGYGKRETGTDIKMERLSDKEERSVEMKEVAEEEEEEENGEDSKVKRKQHGTNMSFMFPCSSPALLLLLHCLIKQYFRSYLGSRCMKELSAV